jgi:hypothetical protein
MRLTYGSVLESKKSGFFGTPGNWISRSISWKRSTTSRSPSGPPQPDGKGSEEQPLPDSLRFRSVGLLGRQYLHHPGTIFKAYVDKDTVVFRDPRKKKRELQLSGNTETDGGCWKCTKTCRKIAFFQAAERFSSPSASGNTCPIPGPSCTLPTEEGKEGKGGDGPLTSLSGDGRNTRIPQASPEDRLFLEPYRLALKRELFHPTEPKYNSRPFHHP